MQKTRWFGWFSRPRSSSGPRRRQKHALEMLEDRTVLTASMVDLAVVLEPTTVSTSGEADTLPASLEFLNEWNTFAVEIWVSTPDTTSQGIVSATVELGFDNRQVTPGEILLGPAFQAQTATTVDAGVVTFDVATTEVGVGDNQFALLGTVTFSTIDIPIDLEVRSIGPVDPGIEIASATIEVAQDGTALAANQGAKPATDLLAVPYDLNDDDRVGFADLAIFAQQFLQPVEPSSPAAAWLSDFDQSGRVGFSDLAFFASNFLTAKPSNDLVFPGNYPEAWLPEENQAPDLQEIDDGQATVGNEFSVVVTATDPNQDDTLTFLLDQDNSPSGATITPLNDTQAVIRWTPMPSDGPGPFFFRVIVLDDGLPIMVDTEGFLVTLDT